MLPILPLLILLLFPHTGMVASGATDTVTLRHELRLWVEAVEAAQQEEQTAVEEAEVRVRRTPLIIRSVDGEFESTPSGNNRVRDGPRG